MFLQCNLNPTPQPPKQQSHNSETTTTTMMMTMKMAVSHYNHERRGRHHIQEVGSGSSAEFIAHWAAAQRRSLVSAIFIWIMAAGCSPKYIIMINGNLRTYQWIQGQWAVKDEGLGTDVRRRFSKRNVSRNACASKNPGTVRCWKRRQAGKRPPWLRGFYNTGVGLQIFPAKRIDN